jgi:hypothetical protein
LHHYSKQLSYGNSQDAPLLINDKKMWHLYTMEFYSATKKKEILLFTRKWMEQKNIILSEVSQVQKAKSHMFLICGNRPNTNTAIL